MGIAGHDQVGVAVYGQFGKFIVRGITAGSDALANRHHFRRRDELAYPLDRRRFDQRRNVRAHDRLDELAFLGGRFSGVPRRSTTRRARAGKDLSLRVALMKMFVSTTTLTWAATAQRPLPAR